MKRYSLIAALFLLALGGLMLHARIHYFMIPDPTGSGALVFSATRFMSFIFSLADLVIVTLLFLSRRTAVYGYLLNGMFAIYGTVMMAHFSLATTPLGSVPFDTFLMKSTLPDIAIAWADFLVGKALYDHYMSNGQ